MEYSRQSFSHRGVMVDLARERTFHMRWMLDLLKDLPRQGANELHLYLENRFAFPSIPGSYPRGSMKPAQARILERTAARLGVRIVPHLNLLGHNENLLSRPRFRSLRAEKNAARAYQLDPLHPKVRPLIARMLRDICGTFSSRLIHVGCDEAIEWKALEQRSRKKAWLLFAEHIRWIHGELRRLGRRTAIWADMVIRKPELLRALPRDIVLFDWCYSGSRPEPLTRFIHAGFETVAATSPVGCFSYLPAPDSVDKQLAFLADASRHGAAGHVATLWELMRGYQFSIEYAHSLPAQWKASGQSGSAETLWRNNYGAAGGRWWRAARNLSRLQWDLSLFSRKPDRPEILNTDASQALTFSVSPVAFELKYGRLWNRRRIGRRLRHVQSWMARARRLPAFRPSGPLKTFAEDLLLTARRLEISLQRALDWAGLSAAFAAGYPAVIEKVLETWEDEYTELIQAFQTRVKREGYGRATVERLKEARANLKCLRTDLVNACRKDLPKKSLAAAVESRWEDKRDHYTLRREIHPVDLA